MGTQLKARLRRALFKVPGGPCLYGKVYAPLRRRFLSPVRVEEECDEEYVLHDVAEVAEGHVVGSGEMEDAQSEQELQSHDQGQREQTPPKGCLLEQQVEVLSRKLKECQDEVSRLLTLQDEWGTLMREVADHVDFLLQFLKSEPTEQGARATLIEHERHLRAFRFALQGVLSRHEAEVRLAEAALVSHKGPQYLDRVQRLERVIEYLVNLQGDDPPA